MYIIENPCTVCICDDMDPVISYAYIFHQKQGQLVSHYSHASSLTCDAAVSDQVGCSLVPHGLKNTADLHTYVRMYSMCVVCIGDSHFMCFE